MRSFSLLAFLVGCLVSLGDLASASQMFSASGVGGIGLHSIDQAIGEPTRIMDLPFDVTDLASNGQSGNAFVWSVSAFSNQLAKIRPATEEVVSIVALNGSIDAIAIDPTDSTFFGVGGTQLFEISPATGELTVIGDLSLPVSINSLTFGLDGTLFGLGSSSLYSINTSDASVSVINDSLSVSSSLGGIAVHPSDGTMFMVSLGIDGYKLFTVDISDGFLTPIGDTLTRPTGLAFATIPEPTTSSLLFIFASFWIIRQRPR